ncbi:Serotype-specific antigen 1 precursor [Marinomonas spartinae]|uniref:phosphatase PAP2 family protein n=1 Tax=Marinomonas spartinae TaxID=1792290 RepID=UPI000808C200|nr:phosphatase PAP2 family protein [Marinomonas spartinae]SBS40083.1 Serotype-specific antigen 1 precursor [Marinomonas spartinae]
MKTPFTLSPIKSSLWLTLFISSVTQANSTIPTPLPPIGLGFEQTVPVPKVGYPLPVIQNGANNSKGNLKYNIEQNPIATLLIGMNQIWTNGLKGWQNDANSNGPSSFANQAIVNPKIWQENIAYVIKVTQQRTEKQAIAAYLDDQRSKNYSVIDGYGPLTQAYVTASGAYTDIDQPTVKDIVSNAHYYAKNNDDIKFAGKRNAPLGSVYQLVYDFREVAPASTSASKYIYSTPRPWRMDKTGGIHYLGTAPYSCVQQNGTVHSDWLIDQYQSEVKVVPGLMCSRRHHESSVVANNQENRRKDGAYPSGHTNAGYLAVMAYAYALPQRYSEMLTRASQLGESRIQAGMHSPVDVIGGRIHALAVATYALSQRHIQADAQRAYNDSQSYFGQQAYADRQFLYYFAHNKVLHPQGLILGDKVNTHVFDNNKFANHEAMKALYRSRLTYGFSQTGKLHQGPVVPAGAELLLATRQPYLSPAQRRAVLATTEVPSGYPILDQSNGWGRLDLVTAADGYGAFNGDVTVNMDANKGAFNAHDWWRNPISGKGKLTKKGCGILTLTGSNQYHGGTIIDNGVLEAASAHALGKGDLYLKNGILDVTSKGALKVANYTQLNGATKIDMDKDASQVQASGNVVIIGGTLALDLSHFQPKAGKGYVLIEGRQLQGQFETISSPLPVRLQYTDNKLIATFQ